MAEQIRQFDATMSEDQRQYNQNMAANWVSDILANGQIPSTDLLAMAGLSYEDAQRLVAKMKTVAKKATPTPAAKDPNELKNLLINNILNTDYITPEERKAGQPERNEVGIAIGYNVTNSDGTLNDTKKMATFTADKLTFWVNGIAAAWFSNQIFHISDGEVTRSMKMGSYVWKIMDSGAMGLMKT